MFKLVEELELDKHNYLDKLGRQEVVRKLVGEYMDIFTNMEKKVGIVLDRYRTAIKLKPGTLPI